MVVWVEGFLSAVFPFFLRTFSARLGEWEGGLGPGCEAGGAGMGWEAAG